MKQSKKNNQWYFGMKANIGADADSGLVYTARGTAGSVNDVIEANRLLHGGGTSYRGLPSGVMHKVECAGASPCTRANASSGTAK